MLVGESTSCQSASMANSVFMETKQTHLDCAGMGDNKVLNIVVQKIISSNIQEFMIAWLTQMRKDFRLVFIQGKDASKE